jgi:hypothetical protein
MKSIKDLREQHNMIVEKEEHDMNKLSQLVRAGLFDAKKLSALKRAMDKPADKMTAQEKRMMINLLDSLMSEVLSDKQVYRKIKQDVMKESKSWETKDYLSKNDPRFGRGFPDQKDMPSVLLLKRKGIRVFPDGQKIGLYYAQAIDKYVSIPFQDINISGHSVNEETQLNELSLRDMIGDGNDESNKKEPKYLKPGESGKSKLNVGGPKEKEDDNDRPDAVRSKLSSMNRDFMNVQAKSARNVRESFMGKLEVLREFAPDPKIMDPIERAEERKNQERINKKNKRTRPLPRDRKADLPKEPPKETPKTEPKTPEIDFKDKVKDTLSDIGKGLVTATKVGNAAYWAWKGLGVKPASPDEPATIKASPEDKIKWGPVVKAKPVSKVATPPPRPIGSLPKAKADAKGTSAFTGMPEKSAPAKAKLPQAPKNPNSGITTISKPSDAPETEVQKKLKTPKLNPAKDTVTGDTPGIKTAQDFADAGKKSREDAGTKSSPKDKGDKDKEEGKGHSRPGLGGFLPGFSFNSVQGKPLTPGSTKLSLNVSGPKREGDPSAIASRTSSLERDMLKAQSKLRESVDLDGNLFELNSKEAKKVTALYESLNTKNKKKMVKMMNENAESLEKVTSFAVRQ